MQFVFLCILGVVVTLCSGGPTEYSYPKGCPTNIKPVTEFDPDKMVGIWHDTLHTDNIPYTCAVFKFTQTTTSSYDTIFKAVNRTTKDMFNLNIKFVMQPCKTGLTGYCADVYDGYIYPEIFYFLHINYTQDYIVYGCNDAGNGKIVELVQVATRGINVTDSVQKTVNDVLSFNNLTRLTLYPGFEDCPKELQTFGMDKK